MTTLKKTTNNTSDNQRITNNVAHLKAVE